MADLYLHCQFRYNTATVVAKYPSVVAPDEGVDFVTGLLSVSAQYLQEYYDFGTANGTTLTAGAAADDTVLTVADSTGMVAGELAAVELDNGLRHVAGISSVDSGTQITLAEGLSSAAASSNNVVSAGQLEGTTDGTLEEDFKVGKAYAITEKSSDLMEYGYDYNAHHFRFEGFDKPDIRLQALSQRLGNDRTSANLTITGITQADPAIVTVSAIEDVRTFDTIVISGVAGMTELNGSAYAVGEITGSTFELFSFPNMQDLDSSGFTAYTSGGTVIKQEACWNQSIIDALGHVYQVADNAEAVTLFQTIFARREFIFGAAGQTGLLAQVSVAENSQSAMDAIVDPR